MLYFTIGVFVGLAFGGLIVAAWMVRNGRGEIQIFEQDGQIYPVLSVNDLSDFDKKSLYVRIRRITDSRK